MCVASDSLPPVPPIAGAAVSHRRLELTAADGAQFAAFAAAPDDGGGVGVVVLPDVRGLFPFYEELALRFAERGRRAVVIDYFGRTAGTGPRDDDFPFQEHVAQTSTDTVQQDVAAAADWLRSPEGGGCRHVFTVGFCFGGRHAWLAAVNVPALAGAVGFYGRPGPDRAGVPGPAQRAHEVRAPIMALMGGDDPHIPPAEVEALERALTEAGVEHEVVTYPGAPHSFFDRRFEQFAAASDDAWRRTNAFIDRHGTAAA